MWDQPAPVRKPFDFATYAERVHAGHCFVCAILARHPNYSAHLVYEDEEHVAFLARYPTLLGYTLVAPKRHVERLVGDLTEDEYLRLHAVVYRIAHAVSVTVPTERVYVLSLGSQQGNSHVHWHVAPLPPGVPYDQQQFHAVMAENGVLDVSDAVQEALAASIRRRI